MSEAQKFTNEEIDLKVSELLSEITDLREELRIAEEDIEDRCPRQIMFTFIRTMIARASSKLRNLVRLRQQRQN